MPGSSTTPGRPGARASAPVRVAFRDLKRVDARNTTSFAAQWLACALPLSTLRCNPRELQRTTRGRCGSLILHRDGLSPSGPCQSPGALRLSLGFYTLSASSNSATSTPQRHLRRAARRSTIGVPSTYDPRMLPARLSLTSMAILIAGFVTTGVVSLCDRSTFAAQVDFMLPPTSSSGSVKVAVGLRILNLSSIDEVTERFELAGNLLAEWRDPRLHYTPTGPGDDFRIIRPGSVWQPQLVIINVVAPRHISEQTLNLSPDGTLHYAERFNATLTSTFALKRFPFDSQTLQIIVHPFVEQQPIVTFVPLLGSAWTVTEFATYTALSSWRMGSFTSRVGRTVGRFGRPISETRFEVSVQRRYEFYLLKIFLPLLLMVFVSWSVFWFDPPEVSSQVTVAVTTILTIIAFAFAISLTLPRVPYLTFADAFFLACYIFAFFAMLELTVVHIAYRKGRRDLGLTIRGIARWLVPAAFFTTNIVLAAVFLT